MRRLNDSCGTVDSATSSYHETITRAYARLLAELLVRCRAGCRSCMRSMRATWVEPDIVPLPDVCTNATSMAYPVEQEESSMAKYGRSASKNVESAMRRRKRGSLKSSTGGKVKSRKQAIAIGLSEAREKGAKVPARKRSRKTAGSRKRKAASKKR
jgi:hypothetical protein